MHENGQKVLAALNQTFTGLTIMGHERDYGNVLVITFEVDGMTVAIQTPHHYDYRKHDYQRWVHQSADLIREKLQ